MNIIFDIHTSCEKVMNPPTAVVVSVQKLSLSSEHMITAAFRKGHWKTTRKRVS